MTIKEIRALTGLSQVRFAERYRIPRRTVENWESGVTAPPEYVLELLEFKILTELHEQKGQHEEGALQNGYQYDLPY